jgi:hypothetical protein
LLTQRLTAGESLFDDDEVDAWKAKQAGAEAEPAGESLFDDDEVAAYNTRQEGGGEAEPEEDTDSWVVFDSRARSLTNDIVFDERGNVNEGGHPDIAFYHVAEFNGERVDEPTYGSAALMEALEKGEDYEVKFAPPSFSQFQCTEKVEGIHQVLQLYDHEFGEEFLERSRKILEDEGVTNTKQLGELEEKDYDAIHLPAIIKSRLRKVRAEARKQSEVADHKVEMDSEEVQAELAQYMAARHQSAEANGTVGQGHVELEATAAGAAAAATGAPVTEEEEEDGTFKSLVWAVLNCPTCKGKETIECFRSCRYNVVLGEEGKKRGWSECLDECIENRWLRATFRAMLPSGTV